MLLLIVLWALEISCPYGICNTQGELWVVMRLVESNSFPLDRLMINHFSFENKKPYHYKIDILNYQDFHILCNILFDMQKFYF